MAASRTAERARTAAPTSRHAIPERAAPRTSPRTHSATKPVPLWLWPNLLSLDAPIVAVLWNLLFFASFRDHGAAQGATHANFAAPLAPLLLALAVWLIYSADRTLDAWRGQLCQRRHRFYHRHWNQHWYWIAGIWATTGLTGAWLAWTTLPADILRHGLWLTLAVVTYLLAVHRFPKLLRWAGSKEAAVATVFGLGTSVSIWSRVATFQDLAAIAVFATLCWINCAAIEDWEAGREIRRPVLIAAACVAGIAALALRHLHPLLGLAATASSLGLLLLDVCFSRQNAAGTGASAWRVTNDAKRVLADAVLLTPLLVFPWCY